MNSIKTQYPTESLITIRDLVKVYSTVAGDFEALHDIQLDIQQGEFVALYGKSGAGKSTLINMITGIDTPTAGEVVVDGVPLHEMNGDELSQWRGANMGIVFQFFQLIPSLTLIENITLPMDFCRTYKGTQQVQRAMHLLELVGISEHAKKIPAKISGGQQQRVAIARALANDPQIIVADEPTGNLDFSTAQGVLEVFSELVAAGKTVIVATHDEEIAQYASSIIEIADGSILSARENAAQRARQVA